MGKDKIRYTFTKSERITSKKIIAKIIQKGKVIKAFPFYVRFLEENDAKVSVKVLIVVGKKRFKRAVDRNRIKRLIRESYRLNKQILYRCLENENKKIVLYLNYVDVKIPDYNDIDVAVLEVFKKICDKLSDDGRK